jgi:proline iminopeptidase
MQAENNNFNWGTIPQGIAGAALIGMSVLLSPLLRPWYTRWGANREEASRPLPGDEYVPSPKSEMTLAVDVQAPPEQVWPWFVQIGCQRAGWYSYDLLDNAGIPSASRLLPEHQRLEIGDVIKAMPTGEFGFPVAAIQPKEWITLGGILDTRTGEAVKDPNQLPEAYFAGDLTFYLEPLGEKATRAIFRQRLDWNPSALNTMAYRVFMEPISFVMARKMLLGIRARVENWVRQARD